jgi:hypothetical protein
LKESIGIKPSPAQPQRLQALVCTGVIAAPETGHSSIVQHFRGRRSAERTLRSFAAGARFSPRPRRASGGRAVSGHSPQVRPIHAETKEADIHPILEGDLSLHRRKSARSPTGPPPCLRCCGCSRPVPAPLRTVVKGAA